MEKKDIEINEIIKEIQQCNDFEKLKLLKSNIFNSKESKLFLLKEKLKDKSISREEKAKIGSFYSQIKEQIEAEFEKSFKKIDDEKINALIENEKNDIFQVVNLSDSFYFNPLALIIRRIRQWMKKNNYFEVVESEITNEEFNFEKLNIPKNHPSRDMQDTLYLENDLLLRTHNTGISAKTLMLNKNKTFSSFSIGKVYRNDEDDQTHSHQFMQVDLISVGDHNIGTLIWTLKSLLSYIFEVDNIKLRMRPSFFPFTEPSIEVDIFYNNRWIEVLGAGMLNEKILSLTGYKKGFKAIAAGIGIERIAMIKYNIKDIREFYKNDCRFLNQFKNY